MNESERGELEETESDTRELTFTKHCCQTREPDQWRVNVNRLRYIMSSLPVGKWRLFLRNTMQLFILYSCICHSCSWYVQAVRDAIYCEKYIEEAKWRIQAVRYVQTVRYCLDYFQSLDYEKPRGISRLISTFRSRSTLRSNRFHTRLLLYSFIALRKFPEYNSVTSPHTVGS